MPLSDRQRRHPMTSALKRALSVCTVLECEDIPCSVTVTEDPDDSGSAWVTITVPRFFYANLSVLHTADSLDGLPNVKGRWTVVPDGDAVALVSERDLMRIRLGPPSPSLVPDDR